MAEWSRKQIDTTRVLQCVTIVILIVLCVAHWDLRRYIVREMATVKESVKPETSTISNQQSVNIETGIEHILRQQAMQSPYLREKWGVGDE